MSLNKMQLEQCESSKWDFTDLKALFLNCTLKRSPELSHTEGLIDISRAIMEKNGVSVQVLRPVDHSIAYGVYPDMTQHGWEEDEWPDIYPLVKAANILVITSPIWLGEKSSVCTQTIERLYSSSGDLNEEGQYAYYGRVGGCLITGNEDGAKHCAMNILYSLQHLGYVIPPQADAAWVGEAGPGPSYLVSEWKLGFIRQHRHPRMAAAARFHSITNKLTGMIVISESESHLGRIADRPLPWICIDVPYQ